MLLFAICTYIFLTQPAFTKKDADVLKQDLKDLKLLQRIRRNSQKVIKHDNQDAEERITSITEENFSEESKIVIPS